MSKKRFLPSFSVFDIIIIAMCAGLGIAVKPVIVPLVHIITGPLFIPGGAAAGGFYMLFVVLAAALTGKSGAATLACAVQAILVIITGVIGSHGVVSVVTYILPGIMTDLFIILTGRRTVNAHKCFFMGMIANVTGVFATNAVFFNLPFAVLMLTLCAGALSGGLGGLIAWAVVKALRGLNPVFGKKEDTKGKAVRPDEK